MAVAPWIVSDALWKRVESLLPRRERRFRCPGRKRLDDHGAVAYVGAQTKNDAANRASPSAISPTSAPMSTPNAANTKTMIAATSNSARTPNPPIILPFAIATLPVSGLLSVRVGG